MSDHRLLSHIDAQLHRKQEELLISEEDDSMNLALYLDPNLVSHLDIDDPIAFLHDGNLNDFWVALEGVSHFLYLIWNASYEQSITQPELELQAEVDKYIITASLIEQQNQIQCLPSLHNTLFDPVDFDLDSGIPCSNNQSDPNHYAAKYCWALEKYFIHQNSEGLLDELRNFYRLHYQDKILRIRNFLH